MVRHVIQFTPIIKLVFLPGSQTVRGRNVAIDVRLMKMNQSWKLIDS